MGAVRRAARWVHLTSMVIVFLPFQFVACLSAASQPTRKRAAAMSMTQTRRMSI